MSSRMSQLSLPECIAVLERMPVRINDVSPMGGGSFLVKFKYFSEKKAAWVAQNTVFCVRDGEVLTESEYCRMVMFIIALSADIEDSMVETD